MTNSHHDPTAVPLIKNPGNSQGSCCHVPATIKASSSGVWTDGPVWKRAAKNTAVCLVGCSMGDVSTLVIAQAYWPQASMWIVMVIAIIAGLGTSMLLESILLHYREDLSWSRAIRTAASMSLLSMIAMEAAMNLTDFALTGGNRMMSDRSWYVTVLAIGAVVGFIAPLPYNYWMLKKHGRACH